MRSVMRSVWVLEFEVQKRCCNEVSSEVSSRSFWNHFPSLPLKWCHLFLRNQQVQELCNFKRRGNDTGLFLASQASSHLSYFLLRVSDSPISDSEVFAPSSRCSVHKKLESSLIRVVKLIGRSSRK